MALPVIEVTKPSDLAGTENGRLMPNQLSPIYLPGVGMGTLHPLAKQAFDWLFFTVKMERGLQMTATTNGDDYRSYEMQYNLFVQRYTPNYIILRNVREDQRIGPDGRIWYKRRGVAAAASPGRSNHGWGLALDCALWMQTKPNVWKITSITTDKSLYEWLWKPNQVEGPWRIGTGSNAESFGLSWEIQSEPWHLRYWCGDMIPKRILDLQAWFATKLPQGV